MSELAITAPDGSVRTVALDRGHLSLGRSGDNNLPFPEDDSLSRHHLLFEPSRDQWSVTDLGSKNGTFVNGVRVTGRHPLHPGDVISAGRVRLQFRAAGPPPVPSPAIFDEDTTPIRLTASTNLASVLSAHVAGVARSDRTISILLHAGRELAARRPLDELFPLILDLAIEAAGAERGIVLTLDNGQLTARASRGEGFRISSAVRDRVLKQRASLLIRDTSLEESLRDRRSIVTQSVRSFMAVPLQTEDRVFGLIYVDASEIVHSFTPGDLDLLTVISNVAAIRIEHERLAEIERMDRLHEAELEQAAHIQQGLLPAHPPDIPGIDLAGFNAACRTVGGDYFDYLLTPDDHLVLALGDVAGKGMPAALLMASLQARVTSLVESISSPSALVRSLNRGLSAYCPRNRFITFFLAILDPASGELTYTNAGHNPTILIRRDGQLELLTDGGPVLAIVPSFPYSEHKTQLCPGDLLFLYSDGLTEAEDAEGEEFGEARLVDLLRSSPATSAESLITAVRDAVQDWTGGRALADDLTMLAVRLS
ncbi:SpoIIE family protein phosphatase [uncultured Paludibaculum sp.]|uniref:SpoIIE family protein phosphatase n=1 Tax=uncultured Paludibaculum sp. TaxID=1765020 RepID=UPI002AAB2A9F|nr:SpoIIE family protein phosphatase [uncultured Paludibaculum sp.]